VLALRERGDWAASDVEATGIGKAMRGCRPLKVDQSAPERKPDTPAEEVVCEKVHWPEEEVIWRPESPEVAKENPVVEA